MLTDGIDIPAPSRYVSHETVDEIATKCNQAYRMLSKNKLGFSIDVDKLIDLLELNTMWEEMDEPEEATLLAAYNPDAEGLVIINEKHRDFFESRPDVYGACLGHEVGHHVLGHLRRSTMDEEMPLLFAEEQPKQQLLHRSTWYQYGMSMEEVRKLKERERSLSQRLVKKALVSETARQTLEHMNDRFEPLWMFRQAEHFSLCLRIPRDQLYDILEEGWDFTQWGPIYRLAERFLVSGTMMKVRLEKLGVIEIGDDGKPRPKSQSIQRDLF